MITIINLYIRFKNWLKRKLAEFIYEEIQILESGEYSKEQNFPEVEELKRELKKIFNTD